VPLETPPQDYYPRAMLRLVVRFEEFERETLKGKAPKKPTTQLAGTKDDRAPLVVVTDPEAPAGTTRFLLLPKGQTPQAGGGSDQLGSADDLTHEIAGVVPKTAEWKQNGIRTPDTLVVDLRQTDFPFHPMTLRAVAVDFLFGTVTPAEHAMGVRGLTRGDVYGGGAQNPGFPASSLTDTWLDRNGKLRTNVRFRGWVDKWKMRFPKNEEPVVHLECVDNVRLFIKQQAPPKLVVGYDKPIDEAVAVYLSNFPQLAGLTVEYRPFVSRDAHTPPRLGEALAGSAFRPQLGPPVSKGGGSTSGDNFNVWDYLTDVCGSIGHSVRVEGTALIVQRVRSLVGDDVPQREDDPYETRNLPSGTYPVRAFVYGANVDELEPEREFGAREPANVEVRAYDPVRKNVLVARFPDKDNRAVSALPGDGKEEQKWIVWRVSGVSDKDTIARIAEDVYHGINRSELAVTVRTTNLASFGGGNDDPDLLDMKAMDSVEILMDSSRSFSTGLDMERRLRSREQCEELMRSLGYSAALARGYARAYTAAGFQRIYRVRESTLTWSETEAPRFEIKVVNYVVSRVDPPPAETGAAASGTRPREVRPAKDTADQGAQQNTGGANEQAIRSVRPLFGGLASKPLLQFALGPFGIIPKSQ